MPTPVTQESLIRNMDEFSEHVAASTNLTIESLKPDILDVQESQLKPLLGADMYERVKEIYGTSYTGDDAELIYRCQKIIANLALAQYQAIGQISITDSGFKQTLGQHNEAVRQWQIDDMRETLQNKAYRAVDYLLEFLEAKKTTYTQWASGESYTINKEFIVSNVSIFQKWHDIQESRKTFISLYPVMRIVETLTVKKALCKDMYARVKNEIEANNITAHVNEFLPDLQAAVVKFSIARAIEQNLVEIRADGLYIRSYKSGSVNIRERNRPNQEDLRALHTSCISDGSVFLENVINHLQDEASASKYPEFYNSTCYISESDDTCNTSDNKVLIM